MSLLDLKKGVLYYHPNELRGGLPTCLNIAESSSALPLDYGWLDTHDSLLLVEHKTLQDCADSLRNSRLRDQLEKAKDVTPYVYLLMTTLPRRYGEDSLTGVRTEWQYSAFYSALLALLHGLQVGGPLTGGTQEETATILETLWRCSLRTALGSGRPAVPHWRATIRGSMAESYARGLGIGWEQAKELEKVYPTWNTLLEAINLHGPLVLTELPRWGKITSERVAKFVVGGV